MLRPKLLIILALILAASSTNIEYDTEKSNWANQKPFRILMSWYLKHDQDVTVRIVHNKESTWTYRLHTSKLMRLIHDNSHIAVTAKNHLLNSQDSHHVRNNVSKLLSNTIWSSKTESTRLKTHETITRRPSRRINRTIFASQSTDLMTIILVPNESTFEKFYGSTNCWRANEVKLLLIVIVPESFDNSLCNDDGIADKKKLWKESFKNILKRIWSRDKILNIFLSAPSSPCIKDYLFKWSPFTADKKQFTGSLKRLKIIPDNTHVELSLSKFENKLENMNGYPLKVFMFERLPTVIANLDELRTLSSTRQKNILDIEKATGLDSSVMKTLASCMNFTIELKSPSDDTEYGYQMNNGSFTGMIGDVIHRRVDFSGNDVFLKDYRTGTAAEFTVPIGSENMCVVVPRAGLIPQWQRIFQCFSPLVWILLLFVVVVYSLLRHVLRTVLREPNPRPKLLNVFIETALIFVSSPQSMTKLESERMLLGFYLLFNLIVIGAFQGTLYEGFTNPKYYKDISTLAELDASELLIGTSSPNLKNLFGDDEDADSPTVSRLRNKVMVSVIAEYSTIARAAWDKNIAAIERQRDSALSINTEFIDEHGESLLHVVEECPRTYQIAYMVPSGAFFLDRTNKLLYRMFESGLTVHWYTSIIDLLIMKHHYSLAEKIKAKDKTKPFGLKNLQISFVVLASGLLISLIIFIAEIVRFRYENNINCEKARTSRIIVMKRNDNTSR